MKMLRFIKILLSFSLLIVLISNTSCIKDVNSKYLPETEPKFIFHCYISPNDTIIYARLTKSSPVFLPQTPNEVNIISNANIYISNAADESTRYLFTYNPNNSFYELKLTGFKINYNEKYIIQVETADNKMLEASCTIPDNVLPTVQVNSFDSIYYIDKIIYRLNFSLTDIPHVENFYRVMPMAFVTYSYFDGQDTIIDRYFQQMEIVKGAEFIKDANNDGEKFTIEAKIERYRDDYFPTQNQWDFKLFCIVASKEYYNYCSTKNNYDDMGLFSEPVTQYSNVKGGIGVFAAYSKFEIPLR